MNQISSFKVRYYSGYLWAASEVLVAYKNTVS